MSIKTSIPTETQTCLLKKNVTSAQKTERQLFNQPQGQSFNAGPTQASNVKSSSYKKTLQKKPYSKKKKETLKTHPYVGIFARDTNIPEIHVRKYMDA